jgi:undecaprenyl-diphosphatase
MAGETLGQFIGAHALLLFAGLALIMLALTAIGWWAVGRWGGRWWSDGLQAWAALLKSKPAQQLVDRFPALRELRENRFVAGGYLGVHSIVGFIFILGALSVFAELADEISEDEAFARFDTALSLTLSQTLAPKALQAFHWITQLGDVRTLVVLGVTVAALLLIQKRWLLAASWSIALAGNGLLNRFLNMDCSSSRAGASPAGMLRDRW